MIWLMRWLTVAPSPWPAVFMLICIGYSAGVWVAASSKSALICSAFFLYDPVYSLPSRTTKQASNSSTDHGGGQCLLRVKSRHLLARGRRLIQDGIAANIAKRPEVLRKSD
jgi:hypothetical protein